MRARFLIGLASVLLLACAEITEPGTVVSLSVAPVFGNNAAFADDANRLKLTIEREDSAGVFTQVAQLFVDIDPVTGEADTAVSVVLLISPTRFRVVLEAIRSSDGAVLFSGVDTVSVGTGSTGGGAPIEIPVHYVGPTAARVVLTPGDTAVEAGSSFTFQAATYDAGENPVSVPVRYHLVERADSVLMTVERLTGAATVATGVEGEVDVYATTPDGAAADTARVLIGAVPVGVGIFPGFDGIGVDGTKQFDGSVVDALGNPLSVFPVQWTSRNPSVATVDQTGLVTGVAPGTTVIVVQAVDLPGPQFSDSALFVVPPDGNVIVSTFAVDSVRAFEAAGIGDTVEVAVTAFMYFTPSELLGSYNATLNWDTSVLSFIDVLPGDNFPAPEVNTTNVSTGELRFAQANANGTAGAAVLAKIRFLGQAAGTTQPTLTISEMSAAVTFTNLIDRITITDVTVTIQ